VLTRHDSTQNTDSAAIFGEASYEMTDRLSATLGGRYTYDRKKYEVDAINLIGVPFEAAKTKSWKRFTPKVALDFQMTDDVLLFGSWRGGYKVGAFQNFPQGVPDVTEQVQKPEDVNAYEVGIKSDWLDRKLRLNLTAFYSDYKDIQFQVLEGLNFIARNADAEIWGTELELAARPVTGLTLYGFLSTLDTKLTKSAPGVPPKGSRLRFSPELQFKVGFDYEWPVGGEGAMFLGSNYTWVDDIYYDSFNRPFAIQDAFGLVDARVGYRTADSRWRFELSGRNLTDEKYALLIQPYGGEPAADGTAGGARHYEAPRTWAMTVAYSF
jgi:iron complex outermembrane receptor protein